MIEIDGGYKILTREEWGATLDPGYPRPVGITEVWEHHTVTIADENYSFEDVNDVISDMKEIERIGKARFNRFPYSFCIHPSGVIAEGGGWDVVGAHTQNHNTRGLGIAAIGNYQANPLPDGVKYGFVNLILYGIRIGKLPAGIKFPTGGHRDLKATACPGDNIYATITEQQLLIEQGSAIFLPGAPQEPSKPVGQNPGGPMTTVTVDLPVLDKTTRATKQQDTMTLQSLLNIKAGQNLVVDGDFYRATEAAVINVQRFCGLTVDGICGKQTWTLLLDIP